MAPVSGGGILAVVVVNHRRHDLLAGCLASLAASTRRPEIVVVVDNESDPAALTAALDPVAGAFDLRPRPDAGNKGYATSCNRGAAAAPEADRLLFLNADTELGPDALAACLDALEADPRTGIVTAQLVRPDGERDHACHRGLPTPSAALFHTLGLDRRFPRSRRLARYTLGWLDPASTHEVEACSGAFLLVRSALLARVGGWDEAYRFYAEDLDLCARVRAAGSRIVYVGSARVLHVKGASSGIGRPEAELDAAQRAIRDRVRGEIARSHRRYWELHLAAGTPRPLRAPVRAWLALTERRAGQGRGSA